MPGDISYRAEHFDGEVGRISGIYIRIREAKIIKYGPVSAEFGIADT